METISGKKQKMIQVFDDVKAYGSTPILLSEKEAVSHFKKGDKVTISGITKGKGFQGVVKRHGFGGGPKSHGQKHSHRAPGSIGATAPQRVFPGRKMAGRMGGEKRTVKNLRVVEVNEETNTLFINGSIPGNINTKVLIRKPETAKEE